MIRYTAALPSLSQKAPQRVEHMLASSERRKVLETDFSTPPVPPSSDLGEPQAAAKSVRLFRFGRMRPALPSAKAHPIPGLS
ncbi:MAG: hypothetical protein JWM16_4609 [Verrucomicrobiales bacterium]|nr:hypothetical protein [Verrucomicrobiales bacterium]